MREGGIGRERGREGGREGGILQGSVSKEAIPDLSDLISNASDSVSENPVTSISPSWNPHPGMCLVACTIHAQCLTPRLDQLATVLVRPVALNVLGASNSPMALLSSSLPLAQPTHPPLPPLPSPQPPRFQPTLPSSPLSAPRDLHYECTVSGTNST